MIKRKLRNLKKLWGQRPPSHFPNESELPRTWRLNYSIRKRLSITNCVISGLSGSSPTVSWLNNFHSMSTLNKTNWIWKTTRRMLTGLKSRSGKTTISKPWMMNLKNSLRAALWLKKKADCQLKSSWNLISSLQLERTWSETLVESSQLRMEKLMSIKIFYQIKSRRLVKKARTKRGSKRTEMTLRSMPKRLSSPSRRSSILMAAIKMKSRDLRQLLPSSPVSWCRRRARWMKKW